VFKQAARTHAKTGSVVQVGIGPNPPKVRCKVLERHVGQSADIGRAAKVVVAGLGCKENLEAPKSLADAIGGVFAVSRPLADMGLAAKDLVVGSSGVALGANVAVVVGVSGAAHFVSGVRGVETVVVVNSDPQAQIFQHADYIVVADATKVLPKVIAELKRSRGGSAQA
jgi:electron transfer flavoprotein alpha subunit